MTTTSFGEKTQFSNGLSSDSYDPASDADPPFHNAGKQTTDAETCTKTLSNPDLPTPISSSVSQTPEYDEEPLWSETQHLRVSYAEAYEEAYQTFLKTSSADSLEALNYALAKTNPEDIDPMSAEQVIAKTRPFLEDNDTAHTLLACQLLVRYDLKRTSTSTITPTHDPEFYTVKFRQVANSKAIPSVQFPRLAQTVELWTMLAEAGDIEEHQSYHLVASSLQWIFGASKASIEASNVRYRFMNLLVATYANLPRHGRYRVVHDLLNAMFHSNDTTSEAVHVLLRIVAVTGSTPLSVWSEATSLRKRNILETDANTRHKEAVALCQMIGRKVIEFGYMSARGSNERELVQKFLDECVSSLMSTQLPSAEVLVSSFISTLFSLSQSHRDRKYCLFSFTVMRTFHDALSLLQCDAPIDVNPVSMISAIESPEQALYLASRQCTLPEQPYFDLHLALEKMASNNKKEAYINQSEWTSFLNQWPISTYYQHMCQQICDLTDREDIPDAIQVELFKLIEKLVIKNPSYVNSRWLDRLSYASASVCEALVPVVAALFRESETKPYAILHKMGTRLAVPGVKHFKKRAIGLFSSVATLSDEGYDIAWMYLLIALADPDVGVSEAASDRAVEMFFAAVEGESVDPCLSRALQAARNRADENSYLVQEGLRKLVSNLSASTEGPRVRRLVTSLLESGDMEMASMLVEADGTFMPLSKVLTVFHEVTSPSGKRIAALRLLNSALNARPRIILSPSSATLMFNTLIARLKTCTEGEMSFVGQILRELVSLGGQQVQQERQRRLQAVLDGSFAKLSQFGELSDIQPNQLVVVSQLIMIVGCVRFWGHDQGLEMISRMVEKLVMFGQQAEAGSSLSKLIVRTVFSVAAEYRVLFNNSDLDKYLASLKQGSPEFDCFMHLLFRYDWHKAEKDVDSSPDGQEKLKLAIMGSAQHEDVLATSSMLQKYLAHILQQTDGNQNVVALRIISKALDHYLIVVDRCLPLVVSLCFSSQLGVAQAALATYAKVCSRWPSSVLTKFVPGLKRCSDLDEVRTGPFSRMWYLARASQSTRNIRTLIEALVASLRHDCTDTYLRTVISGLMQTVLDPKDAKQLKSGLMENVFSFSPRNKAHGAEHVARMIVLHVFETWLTRRYGLVSSKLANETLENENLEYIDIETILQRFRHDRTVAKRAFEELLDEQYPYGSQEMDELIYGKALERQVEAALEPPSKRQRNAI